jgi:hypothetical protein
MCILNSLQYDAAVDPVIAKTKMKGADSKVAGNVSIVSYSL